MPEQINPIRGRAYVGSMLLTEIVTDQLTDAAPSVSVVFETPHVDDVVADVVADKDCDVTITPLPDADDETVEGEASATGTLGAGGASKRFSYASVSAPKAKVTVTKTEAGNTTNFVLAVRGTA